MDRLGLCRHKHVFGRPGAGAHAVRIAGLAFVDLALTLLAALAISWHWRIAFWKTALALILLGVGVHWLFCVDTALNRRLGLGGLR